MTEESLKLFLAENAQEIQAEVKKRFIDKLIAEHRWDISEQIQLIVSNFTKTTIAPAVEKELERQKDPLIAAAITGISSICEALGKGLAEDAAKTLKDEYKRKDIIKLIFGRGY